METLTQSLKMFGFYTGGYMVTFFVRIVAYLVANKFFPVQMDAHNKRRKLVLSSKSSFFKIALAPIREELVFTIPYTIGNIFPKEIALIITSSSFILPLAPNSKFIGRLEITAINFAIWLMRYYDYSNQYLMTIFKLVAGLIFGIGHTNSISPSIVGLSFCLYSVVYFMNLFVSGLISDYCGQTSGMFYTLFYHMLNNFIGVMLLFP